MQQMNTENKQIKITKSGFASYLEKGIAYEDYKVNMEEDSKTNPDDKRREYIVLNQHRMQRVEKTFEPDAKILEQAAALKHKTYWLVLTEHWCGDAAQQLPVFDKLAKLSNGKLVLKLIYRDQQPELMDAYLTNNTRSIPKLIQLDEHYNVNGIWGPRPTPAQNLVKRLRADPETATKYAEELHLWYARDKQQSLMPEIAQLLARANMFCPDCIS
jgi:hypothetical protein